MPNQKNDKAEEIVRLLNTTDWSQGEIAREVGCSRATISGVAYRNRHRITRPRRKPPEPKPKVKPRKLGNVNNNFFLKAPQPKAKPIEEPSDRVAYARKQMRAVARLKPNQCRWPLGDTDQFFFCWEKALTGCSYCGTHLALSRQRGQYGN